MGERLQEIINEKVMYIYTIQTSSPAAFGPKIKGDPFQLDPLIYWAAPVEDFELNN